MKGTKLMGFYMACITSGIVYFSLPNYEGGQVYLISYIACLAVYFIYYTVVENKAWDGGEIFAAFFASALAQWVLVFLNMFF